jgi:hypothetical protein
MRGTLGWGSSGPVGAGGPEKGNSNGISKKRRTMSDY